MNAIEDYQDISIIWSKPKHELTAKNLFIVVQAEVGFVPFILAAGMASKNKHSCEILSRHMSVEAFNKMPDPVPPTWHITQFDKNNALCVITNVFPITMAPDANPEVWYKTYPLYKSFLSWLDSRGFENINFITMNNIEDASEEPQLYVHDLRTKITVPAEANIFLNLPSWALPYLWSKMGNSSVITATTQDEGQFIDERALSLLKNYIVALGVEYDAKMADLAKESVRQVQSQIEMFEKGFTIGGDDEEGEWV
jgi:hypothetical protein